MCSIFELYVNGSGCASYATRPCIIDRKGAILKQKHFIDSHKAVTFIYILTMIVLYKQWENPTAWVYLALHGTYGILWVLKSRIFPDWQWEQPTGWLYGLVIWGGLSLYWVAPWLLMARGVQAPAWYLGLCISLNIFGVFFNFVADMQKYTTLSLQPNRLFTGGVFSKIRSINYFGEMLIYFGFSLLAMHWLPVVILLVWIIFVWLPFMRKKEHRLSRYPEFAAYKNRTKMFIPFLF